MSANYNETNLEMQLEFKWRLSFDKIVDLARVCDAMTSFWSDRDEIASL